MWIGIRRACAMEAIYSLIGMALVVILSVEISLWLGRWLVDCLLRSLTKS